MTHTPTLKPCPFCGGPASVRQWTDYDEGNKDFDYQRFGAGCYAHSDVVGMCDDTEAESIAAWNTRHEAIEAGAVKWLVDAAKDALTLLRLGVDAPDEIEALASALSQLAEASNG